MIFSKERSTTVDPVAISYSSHGRHEGPHQVLSMILVFIGTLVLFSNHCAGDGLSNSRRNDLGDKAAFPPLGSRHVGQVNGETPQRRLLVEGSARGGGTQGEGGGGDKCDLSFLSSQFVVEVLTAQNFGSYVCLKLWRSIPRRTFWPAPRCSRAFNFGIPTLAQSYGGAALGEDSETERKRGRERARARASAGGEGGFIDCL